MTLRSRYLLSALTLVLGWSGNVMANGYVCEGRLDGSLYRASLETNQRWNQTFRIPRSIEVATAEEGVEGDWQVVLGVESDEIFAEFTDRSVIYRAVSREPGSGRFVSTEVEVFRDMGSDLHESSSYFAELRLNRNRERIPVKMICDRHHFETSL